MSCGCGKKTVASPQEVANTGTTLEELERQTAQLAEQRAQSQRNALANASR